jgi:hypothetical protein
VASELAGGGIGLRVARRDWQTPAATERRTAGIHARMVRSGVPARTVSTNVPDGRRGPDKEPSTESRSAAQELPRTLLRTLDPRFSCRHQGALGLRVARQHQFTQRGRCCFFPAHPVPPPALPALVLAVRGPHGLCMHPSAPESPDSRLGRFHRSTLLARTG